MTQCVFCGIMGEADSCEPCVRRYLRCQGCGYVSREYIGKMTEILRAGTWPSMPAACMMCGVTAINKKVKAIGLPQTNFVKLSEDVSYIRRRLWKDSQSST